MRKHLLIKIPGFNKIVSYYNYISNTIRPIFKKPILGLRIESKLGIAGVPTEHLFSLNAWFKRKQGSAGIPVILSLDPILKPRTGFLNMGLMGLKVYK